MRRRCRRETDALRRLCTSAVKAAAKKAQAHCARSPFAEDRDAGVLQFLRLRVEVRGETVRLPSVGCRAVRVRSREAKRVADRVCERGTGQSVAHAQNKDGARDPLLLRTSESSLETTWAQKVRQSCAFAQPQTEAGGSECVFFLGDAILCSEPLQLRAAGV